MKQQITANFSSLRTAKKIVIQTSLAIVLLILANCKKDEPEITPETTKIKGDYYVSINGNDSNSGTEDMPWRTIQKAANTAEAGKIVVVAAGFYDEWVKITKGGSSEGTRVYFYSETLYGAACKGIRVNADYITINGFDIEADTISEQGIRVLGKSNITISNCYLHDCPIGGIQYDYNSLNAKMLNNKIDHNGQFGLSIRGSNALIERNEITRTVQYHQKGINNGAGSDADGMRIFGTNHIIRGNKVWNLADSTDPANIDAHADCIQTWDNLPGPTIMSNTIIEGNYFSILKGNRGAGQGIMTESVTGNPCHHLTIRNNIFEFSAMGISVFLGEYHDIYIYNNIFRNRGLQKPWGPSVRIKNCENFAVVNNIMLDFHYQWIIVQGGTGTIDYNLKWNSDGTKSYITTPMQEHDISSVDPMFVKYTKNIDYIGDFRNDYHLLKNSPAIDKGMTLNDVKFDFDSIARPQGKGYDIGAYEYK